MANKDSKFSMINGVPTRLASLDWGAILGGTSGNPIDSYMANRNITPPVETPTAVPTSGPMVNQPQNRVLPPVVPPQAPAYTPPPQNNQPPTASSNPLVSPTPPAPQTNWMDDFNKGILDMLKSSKDMNTADYYKNQRELDRASYDRIAGVGESDMGTLSPSQQDSIRSGKVSALQPEIDDNAYELKKAEQKIDNFFKIYDRAREMSADFADKMQPSQEAIDGMVYVIKQDPERFDELFKSQNEKGQIALVDALQTANVSLAKPTAPAKRDTSWQNGVLYDNQTGEVISSPTGSNNAGQTPAQIQFLRDTAAKAKKVAESGGIITTPTGPSLATKAIGSMFIGGNTSFNQLQNLSNTLKTNVLTLATDPNIKKFFGPQMSNADVRLMMSGGSVLDPEVQTTADYLEEIKRLDDMLVRMQRAVSAGLQQNNQTPELPESMVLNGQTLYLQADGTYE
jgi:hypothetical protein